MKKFKIISYFILLSLHSLFATTKNQIIAPGVVYNHILKKQPEKLSIHILEIDPTKVRIEPATATGKSIGMKTLSKIVYDKNAIGGINGGFFHYDRNFFQKAGEHFYRRGGLLRLFGNFLNVIGNAFNKKGKFDGLPSGILKIKNKWISGNIFKNTCRGAIGWNKDGTSSKIERISIKWIIKIGDTIFPISHINHKRGYDKTVLYLSTFNKRTLTNKKGTEVIIKNKKVYAIKKIFGNNLIPKNGAIYSVGAKAPINLSSIKVGDEIKVFYYFIINDKKATKQEQKLWANMDYILQGTPVLISDNKIIDNANELEHIGTNFIIDKHPRSAIGIKQNGNWVFVVVDGRQPKSSVGLTLPEFAYFMKSIGCVKALNLDGGGSSTLVLDNKVLNSPSGNPAMGENKKERPISNAILIFTKKDNE